MVRIVILARLSDSQVYSVFGGCTLTAIARALPLARLRDCPEPEMDDFTNQTINVTRTYARRICRFVSEAALSCRVYDCWHRTRR